MGCAFSRNNHRVPSVFRRKKRATSKKYVVSSLQDVHSKENTHYNVNSSSSFATPRMWGSLSSLSSLQDVHSKGNTHYNVNSSSSFATPRMWSVSPNIYTEGWYTPDVAPSTLIWLMGAKDLLEDSIPELVTHKKQVENNKDVEVKVVKDTEEEKSDVEKESKGGNATMLEEELPSCLHYEGFHEKGFHWFTLYSSVLNETIGDMSLNCIPDAIATVLKDSQEPIIIVYKNSDNSTTYLSEWSGEILDRICSRFDDQVLRIVLCKPSWFAQTSVKDESEQFFSVRVTEKLKFASDAREFAKLTGFPGETNKAVRSY